MSVYLRPLEPKDASTSYKWRNKKLLVSICCTTYNQENYIRECLEGILCQKTDFSFELLIHDDASTDKTADIIREYENKYPDIIKPIYQTENQYSKGIRINATFIYPRAKGKYIAICEGDDYWIDPLKLQKQVDFLEKNEDYGLVYTDHLSYFQTRGTFVERHCKKIDSISFLLERNRISTLTTCFRRELLQDYLNNFYSKLPKFPFGDYPLWLYFFSKTKFYLLPEITSVYRILGNSASHSTDYRKDVLFEKKVYECKLFFIETVYPEESYLIEKLKYNYYHILLRISMYHNAKELFLDKELSDFYMGMSDKNNKFGRKYKLLKLNFCFFSSLFRGHRNLKNIAKRLEFFINRYR